MDGYPSDPSNKMCFLLICFACAKSKNIQPNRSPKQIFISSPKHILKLNIHTKKIKYILIGGGAQALTGGHHR